MLQNLLKDALFSMALLQSATNASVAEKQVNRYAEQINYLFSRIMTVNVFIRASDTNN